MAGCNGDAKAAATLPMTGKIEQIVQLPEYPGSLARADGKSKVD